MDAEGNVFLHDSTTVGVDSPFEVLGIDDDADEETVDRAYRRRVLETHPDRGGSAREFKRVTAAYEAIKSGERAEMRASADGQDDESWTRPAGPRQTGSKVEYLNYDVVADFGWDLSDDDLFEKAHAAGLDPADYGRFLVRPRESLLEAAEGRGFSWPYACRGGACANCAVAVKSGELEMPANHILPESMLRQGIRLSCNGMPTTDEMQVVFNLKHRPDLEELRLPPNRFVRDQASD